MSGLHKPPKPRPPRHPGGRTCNQAIMPAVILTGLALARHWRDVPLLWRETKDGGSDQ